jgi:hypothetical protein
MDASMEPAAEQAAEQVTGQAAEQDSSPSMDTQARVEAIIAGILDRASQPTPQEDEDALVCRAWSRVPKRSLLQMLEARPGDGTNEAARARKAAAITFIDHCFGRIDPAVLYSGGTFRLLLPLLDAIPFVDAKAQTVAFHALHYLARSEYCAAILMAPGALDVLMCADLLEPGGDETEALWRVVKEVGVRHRDIPDLRALWISMAIQNLVVSDPIPVMMLNVLSEFVQEVTVRSPAPRCT